MDDSAAARRTSNVDTDKKWQMTAEQLCVRDPLAKLLLRLSQGSVLRITLAALVIYGVLVVGAGVLISIVYTKAGYQFLSILDKRELPIALYIYLVLYPLLWTYYTWQPNGILYIFRDLSQNGVIGENRSSPIGTFVQQTVGAPSNRVYNLALALGITLAGIIIYPFTAHSPNKSFFYGFPTAWWLINPCYTWALRIPLVFVNAYILVWIIIRQTTAVHSLTRFFRSFEIIPQPFHPDRCNGLASVGDYAMRSTLIAVLFGLRLSIMISFPMFFGQPMNLEADTVFLLIIYAFALPALLIPSVWESHRALVRAKSEALEAVAVQIRTLLSEKDVKRSARLISLVEQLEKKYELIDKEYKTWPFRPPALKRLGVTALVPLLSAVISTVIDALLT